MASPSQRRREPRWRCYFRRTRIAFLLLLFGLIGFALYLNQVGLPVFLQERLLAGLRERGLDLQVSKLHWHFYRGIVGRDVRVGRMGDVNGPRFSAREAELNLNFDALLERRIEVSGVGLRDGQLKVPVNATNEPARYLAIEKIRADVRLLPNDAWSLDDFRAEFAGANFFLTGNITNASAVRDWPLFRERPPTLGPPGAVVGGPPGRAPQRLQRIANFLEQIHFGEAPEIRGMLTGDARELESFTLRLSVSAPDAETPWGKFSGGVLTARLRPAAPVEQPQALIQMHAASVQTPWAEVQRPNLDLYIVAAKENTNLVSARLTVRAAEVNTRWAVVTNALFTATWDHSLTNAIPLAGMGDLRADSVSTPWAGAREFSLKATLGTLANPPLDDPALGPWRTILPYVLGWSLKASQCDTEKLAAEEINCSGLWSAPEFTITNLSVRFPTGRFDGQGRLDVNTREASFGMKSDFDLHQAKAVLSPKAAAWLNKYTWQQPPHIAGNGAVVLPGWTNHSPELREEVLPTLRLAASLAATNAAYLKIPVDWVQTHITFTNEVWHLPDLKAHRADGDLELAHIADDKTREYWFGLHSTLPPEILRPLLSTNAQRGLDFVKFATPPDVRGGIWGRWRDNASIAFTGHVAVANFSYRGQSADHFESSLRYTNRFLEFYDPHLERGTQTVHGAGITADFEARRIYFTNVFSTAEPLFITRAIGPKTTAALEPYIFHVPPTVLVNGYAPLGGNNEADLRFDVDGSSFEWGRFHIPRIAGHVRWGGNGLALTNIQLAAYGGGGAGYASFDFGPSEGTPFKFGIAVTNVDLKALMQDLATRTNHLEGRFDGKLIVTEANATNHFSWNGYGNVALRDGLIWSIPIFGLLSKPLDTVMPGLGKARISEGSATFIFTNGVAFSDTLEMRASTMRLQYQGTVDFAGQVNAKVRAEPLRDTAVIGAVLNLALWPVTKLMEYRISGSLADPKAEPLYIPKVFYKPFLHPFRTLEDIFTPDVNGTNAAPKFAPLPEQQ